MTLSNDQLLTPLSETEALETCLEILRELGFPVTAWQPGRVQHTRVRLIARLYSELTQVIAGFTLGSTRDAAGDYADLRGLYVYNEEREPSVATQGYVHIEVDLTAPGLSYGVGETRIQVGSQVYENLDAIDLDPGEEGDILVQAILPGAAGNVATDSSCAFVSPLLTATVTNPEYAEGTWVTVDGRDAEEDSRYLTRAEGKIERLAYGSGEGAYKVWVLEALPEIPENRVNVTAGPGEGDVEIIAATAEGALTGTQISTIEDYLNGTDGVGRRPINDNVTVGTVTEVTTPALSLTVYVRAAFAATAESLVTEAIEAYLESLPIGGEVIGSPPGAARQAAIINAVMSVEGVVNVTGVPADVTLVSDEIYVPAIAIVVVSV